MVTQLAPIHQTHICQIHLVDDAFTPKIPHSLVLEAASDPIVSNVYRRPRCNIQGFVQTGAYRFVHPFPLFQEQALVLSGKLLCRPFPHRRHLAAVEGRAGEIKRGAVFRHDHLGFTFDRVEDRPEQYRVDENANGENNKSVESTERRRLLPFRRLKRVGGNHLPFDILSGARHLLKRG